MTDLSDDLLMRLSAYVDGELPPEDTADVEALIASDPAVAAEVAALSALNDDLRGAFDGLLEEPVPEPVAAPPANTNRPPLRALAASLVLGAFLGAGGLWMSGGVQQPTQVAARSWLGEIAEYHQVYARQGRHLVEVSAAEKPHIESWLGKEIGVPFTVPDLASAGWEFQGARLLLAAGQPVAQLLYTDANGQVIALCALHNGSGAPADIDLRAFGDVHMAVWKDAQGSYAIVGDTPADLPALAAAAAPLI